MSMVLAQIVLFVLSLSDALFLSQTSKECNVKALDGYW